VIKASGRREKRAVFLDRDGTINVEKDYLFRPEEFEFIPGVPEAIRRLRERGFLVFVVTNQSGVARGYFTLEAVNHLHDHIQQQLRILGTEIDGFFICPHHPTEGQGAFRRDCECRKGQPGMLLQAAAEHSVDLGNSFMVGDKMADLEAGRAAGCHPLLVLTGYGEKELAKGARTLAESFFEDLPAAVEYILNH